MIREREDKFYTPAFEELRQLAYTDWATFCKRIGEEHMTNAVICSMKQQGYSMGKLAVRYNINKRRVKTIVENKCFCDDGSKQRPKIQNKGNGNVG